MAIFHDGEGAVATGGTQFIASMKHTIFTY